MKLTRAHLFELQDYIQWLDEQAGLSEDTLNEIGKVIDRELDKIREEENLINHIDNLNQEP